MQQTESPFTVGVLHFPLLEKFKMSQIETFDRTKDPIDHLNTYKNHIELQGYQEPVRCRAFTITLKGPTLAWFNRHADRDRSPRRIRENRERSPTRRGNVKDRRGPRQPELQQRYSPQQYSPLTASVSQVLRKVQHERFLRWPSQMKSNPAKRDDTKYCEFHKDHGHRADDCIQLKKEI